MGMSSVRSLRVVGRRGVGVRNDVAVFARLNGDTVEHDRLCRFHRPRDLAQNSDCAALRC
jgi:hypothetical protein